MSLLTDVFSTLDSRSLGEMAGALGESDKSLSEGLRSAVATLLGGMAVNASNPNLLRQTMQLVPPVAESVSWPNAAAAVVDPSSPAMSVGKRVVSTLFGDSTGFVTNALASGIGLPSGKVSSLLAMAAPIVMSFLGKRVRDEGMSMTGLGNLLQHETPAIRAALPQRVADLLWPHERGTIAAAPVAAHAATAARSSRAWLLPLLLLLALIPALLWLAHRGHRPAIEAPSVAVGTANRAIPEPAAEIPKPSLPGNLDVYFESGSTTLKPGSQAKLKEFAGSLAADPSAHVAVNGYTDNVGNPEANLRLSQRRADAVRADLVRLGIPADRLSAQGFGEENPSSDNATAEGRGANRRVSVGIGER